MAEKELFVVEGTVENIVFHSEDTGFTVLEIDDGEQLLTVVGEGVGIEVGEQLRATGYYTTHATYGSQFKASVIERTLPATASAILKYLSSGAIKGVGPALAKRIVDAFGDDTLEVLEKTPERLSEVKGISPKKAIEIEEEYKRIFGIRSVMLFLSKYNIDAVIAIRVWKMWGMLSPDLIKANPYCLCNDEIGVDFPDADEIAVKLELPRNSSCRLAGGVLYVLQRNVYNGHCCIPYDKLVKTAKVLLDCEEDELLEIIERMIEDESLISDTIDKVQYLYLPNMYLAETYVAGRLQMAQQLSHRDSNDYTKDIDELENALGIEYADLQKKAIAIALQKDLLILTGGPGTGKTTTLNGIINMLEKKGLKVALAAPTGRAAKRMTELTGREAKTIHRLLEVDFKDENGRNKFKRNMKNPLQQDAVVIDEMSMIDIQLFESLVRAIRMGCKLIMVGDPDQLPSVGAGNVLKDLIDSEIIEVVHLTQVFRQAAQSLIVTNAHSIVRGELPDLNKKDNDFFFMPEHGTQHAIETVISLCGTRLPKAYGYSSLWDIQVISPTRVGALGTVELNKSLQNVLNPRSPSKTEFKFGAYTFREGDKVMQIKNNYDIIWRKGDGEEGTGIFNGDIGVIDMIDKPSQSILVKYDDRIAEYVFDMADELDLAYAITVHKSQGSEFEAVIMTLSGYHSKLHYRNLLYTGVTRARKLLIIVGQAQTVQSMVGNDRKTLRYTNLKEFLRQ